MENLSIYIDIIAYKIAYTIAYNKRVWERYED